MPKVESNTQTRQPNTFQEEIDTQVSLIQAFIPLGLMAVEDLLYQEVEALAGPRYHRKEKGSFPGYRWGTNPGSVYLGETKVKTAVPRVRDKDTQKELSLKSYEALQKESVVRKQVLLKLIGGLSCRRYSECTRMLPEVFGVSSSSLSRHFMEVTEEKLKAFEERELDDDYIALFIDGKTFARQNIIIALGVTTGGKKVPLGFRQGATEHHQVCRDLLQDLLSRGLKIDRGLIVIIDGSKGLRKAVDILLHGKVLVQRCQWHKRENVVSYLPKSKQKEYRKKLQAAYQSDTYSQAKEKLGLIQQELAVINRSASQSLEEGLEETLTVLKLNLPEELRTVFKTTNCIESLNSQMARLTGRVTRWQNSKQIHRWVASSLLDIETRMRRIRGYQNLNKLRQAIQKELKLETTQIS